MDSAALPWLACRRAGAVWETVLETGWDAAPPGPRRVAALFGVVLAEEAHGLERAGMLAAQEREQERERQTQARLAELGALAAAVAHDVRNPLNIIGMAVAMADPDTRAEVSEQIGRIARLTDDLLEYAKPWSVTPMPHDLTALAREAAARRPGVACHATESLLALADSGRVRQALDNLLDNAQAVSGRVGVETERGEEIGRAHV